MASLVIYLALIAAAILAFFASVLEATYLTVKSPSLFTMQKGGSRKAETALKIVGNKTKLVTVTTFMDTFSNVVLATSIGIILSEDFGPLGWVVGVFVGSFLIMIFLSLVPKALGIENPVTMAVLLAPAAYLMMDILSPIATPLATISRKMAGYISGKPMYSVDEIADEFEHLIDMLEADGKIEPDAGRILRTTLAASHSDVLSSMTPIEKIVSVDSDTTVMEALKVMGSSSHPRIPVYDRSQGEYVGVLTFRSLSKGISEQRVTDKVSKHMVTAAKIEADESISVVAERMGRAGVTIAFVYRDARIIGVITLTDLLERILGFKLG